MEKMVEEGKVQNWFNLSQMITEEPANVAGDAKKKGFTMA